MEPLLTRTSAVRTLGVACASAAVLLPIVRVYQPTLDEGTYIDGAARILAGALPYRDFIEPAAPGSFYWIALWFRLFGTSFATARTLLLLTGVALVALSFVLARRLGGRGYIAAGFVLVTSVPMMVMNSPHYDSNVLVLAAVLAFLSGRIGVAGACLGLADLCMQGKGLYILVALCAWLLWSRNRRAIVRMLGAWAMPLIVTGAWFLYKHGVHDAIFSTVLWPITSYSAANSAPYAFPLVDYIHHWWNSFAPSGPFAAAAMVALWSAPFFFVAFLPVLAPGISLLTGTARIQHVPVWVAGFALLASELHRHDLEHLLNGSLLLAILFFTVCETAPAMWPARLGRAFALSLCLYGAVEISTALMENGSGNGRRGTLLGQHANAVLDFLNSHTTPGQPVFVYPYRPVFYFWAGVRNPTRYTLLMYGYNTNAQFEDAVHALESQRVRYVLWDQDFGPKNARTVFPAYRPPDTSKQIMEPYLMSRYHPVATIEGFSVLERNSQ